jgi:hypothetical protein
LVIWISKVVLLAFTQRIESIHDKEVKRIRRERCVLCAKLQENCKAMVEAMESRRKQVRKDIREDTPFAT